MIGTTGFGCGRCIPCRIRTRRIWVTRLILESYTHDQSAWVTLTYSDDNLPEGSNLSPAHMRNFLKRLRNHYPPGSVRFFGVGEYGLAGRRGINPHYHLILFGCSVADAPIFEKCWTAGLVHVDEVNRHTIGYTCGYTLKKLTNAGNPLLDGRHPEFKRSSNRPGIGAEAALCLAHTLGQQTSWREDFEGDVPSRVRLDGQVVSVGRYLRDKMRDALDVSEETREKITRRYFEDQHSEMLALLNDAKIQKEKPLTFKDNLKARNQQQIWSAKGWSKLQESKRKI